MEDQSRPDDNSYAVATDSTDSHGDHQLLADEPPLEGTRDRTLSTPPPDLSPALGLAVDTKQATASAQLDPVTQLEPEHQLETSEEDAARIADAADDWAQPPPPVDSSTAPTSFQESPPTPSPSTNGPSVQDKAIEPAAPVDKDDIEGDVPADEPPKEHGLGEKVKKVLAPAGNLVANARKAFEGKPSSSGTRHVSLYPLQPSVAPQMRTLSMRRLGRCRAVHPGEGDGGGGGVNCPGRASELPCLLMSDPCPLSLQQ